MTDIFKQYETVTFCKEPVLISHELVDQLVVHKMLMYYASAPSPVVSLYFYYVKSIKPSTDAGCDEPGTMRIDGMTFHYNAYTNGERLFSWLWKDYGRLNEHFIADIEGKPKISVMRVDDQDVIKTVRMLML